MKLSPTMDRALLLIYLASPTNPVRMLSGRWWGAPGSGFRFIYWNTIYSLLRLGLIESSPVPLHIALTAAGRDYISGAAVRVYLNQLARKGERRV